MRLRLVTIIAVLLALVAAVRTPRAPLKVVQAGSSGIVYYHGRELIPPWTFTFDADDTLRLNGRAVVPRPAKPEGLRPYPPPDPLWVKREACIEAAKAAYNHERTAVSFESALRSCSDADIVEIKVSQGSCADFAYIVYADSPRSQLSVMLVDRSEPTPARLDLHERQAKFVRDFREFMSAPDHCYILGRTWEWRYERVDPTGLRAAVARFRTVRDFRPGLTDSVLVGIPRDNRIWDPDFQRELVQAEPPSK